MKKKIRKFFIEKVVSVVTAVAFCVPGYASSCTTSSSWNVEDAVFYTVARWELSGVQNLSEEEISAEAQAFVEDEILPCPARQQKMYKYMLANHPHIIKGVQGNVLSSEEVKVMVQTEFASALGSVGFDYGSGTTDSPAWALVLELLLYALAIGFLLDAWFGNNDEYYDGYHSHNHDDEDSPE